MTVCPDVLRRLRAFCLSRWCHKFFGIPKSWREDATQDVLCRLSETILVDDWNKCLVNGSDENRELQRAMDNTAHKINRREQGGLSKVKKHKLFDRHAIHSDPSIPAEAKETRSLLLLCIRILPCRQRRIIFLLLQGKNSQEIKDTMSLKFRRVADLKWEALQQLRQDTRLQSLR